MNLQNAAAFLIISQYMLPVKRFMIGEENKMFAYITAIVKPAILLLQAAWRA